MAEPEPPHDAHTDHRDMNARTQGVSKDRIAPLRWSPSD
jgi:hypothetical protein